MTRRAVLLQSEGFFFVVGEDFSDAVHQLRENVFSVDFAVDAETCIDVDGPNETVDGKPTINMLVNRVLVASDWWHVVSGLHVDTFVVSVRLVLIEDVSAV